MTLKKLHAGEGYTYLTRQVAVGDNSRKRGEPMVDYYTAHGLPAGKWFGKGAQQLGISGEVTEDQMRAAYGEFLHPDADAQLKELLQSGVKPDAAMKKVRLGAKPYDFNRDIPFMQKRKKAIEDFTIANKRVATDAEREAIELTIAREMLPDVVAHSPQAQRELVANAKRMARYPVAGYDLVFTPMKSISVLWGIGDEDTRKAIMAAHTQAVDESLQWIEDNAIYTRGGKDGVRKLDCAGMTAAKFVHWDNRAGDPNLHTHCAVLNRVFSEGKYRTIDGTVLYRAAVTASEHYNARVKALVEDKLNVSFKQVEKSRGARKVWEISEVPDTLLRNFSRSEEVVERAQEMIEEYRSIYHREPPKSVQWTIMQQANLQTRGKKGEAKALKELVEQWRKDADAFDRESVLSAVAHSPTTTPFYDESLSDEVIERVIETVSSQSSTWTTWTIESEVNRELSHFRFDSYQQRQAIVDDLVTQIAFGHCISVDQRDLSGPYRADGESQFYTHGSQRFTHQAVLDAEDRLHHASDEWMVNLHTEDNLREVEDALEDDKGFRLSADQSAFVRHLLYSPARLAVGTGAAGTGKTTAMEAFCRAWEKTGNRVVAFAPSAKAAEVLGESIGVTARTLASARVSGLSAPGEPELREGDVVLVDEAGMASTRDLDALVQQAGEVGAFVRLVGDPQQLAAVETGGMIDELAAATDAPLLTEVRRFNDPDEADVSLRLRDGDVNVVDWYEAHDRIVTGLAEELPAQVFAEWQASRAAGKTALMIAADKQTVATLNDMARQMFIETGVVNPDTGEAELYAGEYAAAGDVVVTRKNDSRLRYGYGKKKRVKNGDLWTVDQVHDDGSLTVRHIESDNKVVLPADYVRDNVELGYASTVHRSQGMTVDEALLVASPQMDRQGFYVGMTRGKALNKCFIADDFLPDLDEHTEQLQPPSARDALERIIRRDGRSVTAHAALRQAAAETDFDSARAAYFELANGLAAPVWQAACPDEHTRQLLADDPQTTRLTETIAALDASRRDTHTVLSRAISSAKKRWDAEMSTRTDDETEPAPSLAFYTRVAIEDWHVLPDDSSLLWTAGLSRLPQLRPEVMDAETYRAAETTAEWVEKELVTAGDAAVSTTPEWTEKIGADSVDPEKHLAWMQAVRIVAAARTAGTIDMDNLDEADERITSLIAKVRRGNKDTATERDERMDLREVDNARAHCQEEKDRALAEQQRQQQLASHVDHAQQTVVAEEERARRIAAIDARITACVKQVDAAAQRVDQAHAQVAEAEQSFIFGRKDRVAEATTVLQTARDDYDQASAALEKARDDASELDVNEQEWGQWVALAGNTAEWDKRRETARRADERDADYARRRARVAGREAAVWQDRIDQLDKLAEQKRPANAVEMGVIQARIDAILKPRRDNSIDAIFTSSPTPTKRHSDENRESDSTREKPSLLERIGLDKGPDLSSVRPGQQAEPSQSNAPLPHHNTQERQQER